MRCLKCGGKYRQRTGNLRIQDDLIGFYTVYGVEWKECPVCKKRRYPISTVEKMESVEHETRDSLLQGISLSDFVSSAEAVVMVGISRQAFHKHRRIRRGFIYATIFDGKKVYLKKSVEAYKKTGDGRITLYKGMEIENVAPQWCVSDPVTLVDIGFIVRDVTVGRIPEYGGSLEKILIPTPQYREESNNGQLTIH